MTSPKLLAEHIRDPQSFDELIAELVQRGCHRMTPEQYNDDPDVEALSFAGGYIWHVGEAKGQTTLWVHDVLREVGRTFCIKKCRCCDAITEWMVDLPNEHPLAAYLGTAGPVATFRGWPGLGRAVLLADTVLSSYGDSLVVAPEAR